MTDRRETDLYQPIKALLTEQGYRVRGEVRGCDLVAIRGDELVVVELKLRFTLPLVLQGVERQRLTDSVYLAFEAPRGWNLVGKRNDIRRLCRKLGLGLMVVTFLRSGPRVEVICDPTPYVPRREAKQRRQLIGEFAKRSGDHTPGGSNKRPVVTAYRETALRVAAQLAAGGPAAPRTIRAACAIVNAAAILQRDHYGWFVRVERGVYDLSPAGQAALSTYADVLAAIAAGHPESGARTIEPADAI